MGVSCSVSWCDLPVYATGYCELHYQRHRLGRDMDAPIRRNAGVALKTELRDQITHAYQTGTSITVIAREHGIDRGTVVRWLKGWGIYQDQRPLAHGTLSCYRHRDCRCPPCVESARSYAVEHWQKSKHAAAETAEHGTALRYKAGCRCDACTAARRREARAYNDATRPTASRHRQLWTGYEAEVAWGRTDLTIAERARLIGRTHAAVTGWIAQYRKRPDDPFGVKRS